MTKIVLIGLDVAKHVFQLHAVAADGRVVFRRQVRRPQLTTLLMSIPSCRIAMEACGTAHYWGRQLEELGHEVLLIPPDYVRPFVKRQKNDAADAEAIAEAAQRPDMRFVRVKSEASQAASIVFRARDLVVRQKTQLINAIRSHLAEFGYIFPTGSILRGFGDRRRAIGRNPMRSSRPQRMTMPRRSMIGRWPCFGVNSGWHGLI